MPLAMTSFPCSSAVVIVNNALFAPCVRAVGQRLATLCCVLVSQQEALAAARLRMHSVEGKKEYKVRAGIEGTLSQGVRAFGLRRTRYRGLAKTSWQHAVTATAINVSRALNWLDGVQPSKTRTSCFAALAAA